ncbi:hypothetical protein PLESTM_002041300 [Pleodorina starrii]|nr:hypothetical protein PLESTM_002041300 [Pleodorina starrii]
MANATKRPAAAKARGKPFQEVSFAPASAATELGKSPMSSSTECQSEPQLSKGRLHTLRVLVFNIWCVMGGPIWNETEMSIVFFFILVALALGLSGAVKQLSKLVTLLHV